MKKSTRSWLANVKYLILTRGPGETSQAVALAKYLSQNKGEVVFCLKEEKTLSFFAKCPEFRTILTKEPGQFIEAADKEEPSVLLIFNSKLWSTRPEFLLKPCFKKIPLVLAVDSNWLFNKKDYPAYPPLEWADKYIILFPRTIFELGLKANGGAFRLDKALSEKILAVGFVPSYQKPARHTISRIRAGYGVKPSEKFIFAYFSGFGAGHRVWAFNNLSRAVERLLSKGYKIKILYVGPRENLDQRKLKKEFLLSREDLPAQDYFLTLASADLVFQHQGLATLAQGIAAQVPIIANVSVLKDEKLAKLHFWEVQPFAKAGVCALLSKTAPIRSISQKIEELLYNKEAIKKMRSSQKAIFEKGEERVFDVIRTYAVGIAQNPTLSEDNVGF